MAKDLTHFSADGRPVMVDVTDKADSDRRARAQGRVFMSEGAYTELRARGAAKGDIKAVSELAGIMAAKRTADIIPLCHPLALSSVSVTATFNDTARSIDVAAEVKCSGKTGVEMEALTAVSVACLTIYDMAKALDKTMTIGEIALVEKSGGRSGDFRRAS